MSLCLIDKASRLRSEESDCPGQSVAEVPILGPGLRALGLLDRWTSGRARPDTPEVSQPQQQQQQQTREEKQAPLAIISLAEVAWHDTLDDCWLVVCDYVYDCTEFLGSHPGGQDVLLEYAGRDATLAFIGSGHSQAAKRLLEKFLVGELPEHERIFRTPGGIKVGDFV